MAETETDESAAAIKYYIKWADQYKKACKLIYGKDAKLNDFKKAEQLLLSESQRGNVLAVYDLGKLYSTDKLGERNEETSIAKYTRALQGFLQIEPNSKKLKPYVQYRIGKMFCYGLGTEQDYEKAFEWFERSAKQKNKFAQFSLANLYYYGSGVEKICHRLFFGIRDHPLRVSPMRLILLLKCTDMESMSPKITIQHRDITNKLCRDF